MFIGTDNKQQKLQIGDICKFTIDNAEHEGIIIYDEDTFAYCFEMLTDNFPLVLMKVADLGSIEKIINVWSTSVNDDKYNKYREFISG